MGTEESLGLGQAQCRRQVQTRSQQDALMGQRIQTGSESEQRRGISPHSHPTRPGSSLLQGYIWLRLASWPQPLLPYGLLSRARPSCCWRGRFSPCPLLISPFSLFTPVCFLYSQQIYKFLGLRPCPHLSGSWLGLQCGPDDTGPWNVSSWEQGPPCFGGSLALQQQAWPKVGALQGSVI